MITTYEFVDERTHNLLRIVRRDDAGGAGCSYYFEMVGRHNGAEVHSIVEVSRDRFRDALRILGGLP